MEIKILCPQHGVEETIGLPDGYSSDFTGEIPCNPASGGDTRNPIALRIRLAGGKVTLVEIPR